ncbi:YgdI/YgdR family lipoprotein [Anatilimnocola floriformis]|uniref:YgdI/YgdR family lipoprotein n=1 Tax=Anatilimnocola floriformis TaxID=2948575 RepID=UPI0020C2B550|nr:YgdI/YgdR family lipoprotein [Anatilimnocola floriformis]
MKKIWILSLLALAAVSLSGCSSCGNRGLFGGLFNWNRGSDCGPPPCASNVGPPVYSAGSPVMMAEPGPGFIPAGQ